MTYDDALDYLQTFVNYERAHDAGAMRAVKLDRMRRLCRAFGEPQRRFRSIHVAGTNGKGSICAMLYAMLRAAGLRAGLYVSPHLEDVRERIRVWDGGVTSVPPEHGADWISREAFAQRIAQLQPVLEAMRRDPDGPPTHFEIVTAAAFLEFAQRRVEVGVVEVGLGGRLDATNVLEPTVAAFGPIALDHTDVLGDDLVLIAREKAGILKPGQLAVTVSQADIVDEVLRVACETQGVPLWRCGQELTARVEAHTLEGVTATITAPRGIYESLRLPLLDRKSGV